MKSLAYRVSEPPSPVSASADALAFPLLQTDLPGELKSPGVVELIENPAFASDNAGGVMPA